MEKSTIFVVMDSNSTPNGSQEQGKKSGNEGFQEKGQAGSEALSLLLLDSTPVGEVNGMVEWMETFKEIRLPEVSGFRMSRKV